ncbi:hypothetical protein GCM10007047_26230 [Cerasicoccus arenae]|uniref:Uncharacterized protein n=1 Tax=Cerasicoccus arenae TaxID=424488 RepID=A0A8J3GF13_9BACT|nr:hypothetical protein GCM10007047_26230 [Cerasicoccus arenae]
MAKSLPDGFIKILEVWVADFCGNDFDREVGEFKKFFRSISANSPKPNYWGLADLLFDDAGELIVGELAAAG